jgi:Ca2+-binding EF-hand superfamily protein
MEIQQTENSGNINKILGKSDIDQLQRTTHFKHRELQHLHSRFTSICRSDGLVDKNTFLQLREFSSCSTLLGIAFDYESRWSTEKFIDFEKFVKILSHFSTEELMETKAKCKKTNPSFYISHRIHTTLICHLRSL